ncbi:hypothetical protein ACISSW_26340, partial [Escherichia coli]
GVKRGGGAYGEGGEVQKQAWSSLVMGGFLCHVAQTKGMGLGLGADTMPQQGIDGLCPHFRVSTNLLDLANLVQVAELIVRCAMMRKESRGLHFTLDYPQLLTHSGPSILSPGINYINR